ncbi:MAG: hypothetical protein ABIO96_02790 [Nitrospiraceae bacterium]
MNRPTAFATPIFALTLFSLLWLGSLAPAQAATVIDRFEFKGTTKEWCQGNPKFFESDKAKATDGALLTFTRDVNAGRDYTDISATFGLTGSEPDVIPMKGRAFPRNKSGSKAEFALSGVNPGNADHFLTIRGHATFDTLGNLTKVTGTFEYQITDWYPIDKFDTPSAPVECFGSGTFATGKKNTSSGGGTLTVQDAPASVGATFVADPPLNKSDKRSWGATVLWGELPVASPFHNEVLGVAFNTTHHLVAVIFAVSTLAGATPHTSWQCILSCAGVTIDRTMGIASFTDTVLTNSTDTSPLPPIRLNGTLTFTPF